MRYLLGPVRHCAADPPQVGGKGYALARLAGYGFRVPATFCLTTAAYNDYIDATGLRERILMELNRKDFKEMRWEEIWDASLRIRNLFLTTSMPVPCRRTGRFFPPPPGRSRCSGPFFSPRRRFRPGFFCRFTRIFCECHGGGGHPGPSQAGLGLPVVGRRLALSPGIGLDIEKSSMAVVIQELVSGDVLGVAFSRNPNDETQAVVEAVYGLNQGLVDGVD